MQTKSWTTNLIEAEDGSGDLLLQFPDELIAEMGWKEGTILNFNIQNGVAIITEKKNESI